MDILSSNMKTASLFVLTVFMVALSSCPKKPPADASPEPTPSSQLIIEEKEHQKPELVIQKKPLAITDAAFIKNDKILATANGNYIDFWDLDTKRLIRSYFHQSVAKLAASPDGRLLASVSFSEIIKVWDIASGSLIMDFEATQIDSDNCQYWKRKMGLWGASSLKFNQNGDRLAIGYMDGHLEIWDLSSKSIAYLFNPYIGQDDFGYCSDPVQQIVFPDSRPLIVFSISNFYSSLIYIVNTPMSMNSPIEIEGNLYDLAVLGDELRAVYSLSDKVYVGAYDISSGRMLRNYVVYDKKIDIVKFNRNGSLLYCFINDSSYEAHEHYVYNELFTINVETLTKNVVFQNRVKTDVWPKGNAVLKLDREEKQIALWAPGADPDILGVYNLDSWKLKLKFIEHDINLFSKLAPSPNPDIFNINGEFYDINQGRPLWITTRDFIYSPTGDYVAVLNESKNIEVRKLKDGQIINSFETSSAEHCLDLVSFHPFHSLIATADNGSIIIWDYLKSSQVNKLSLEKNIKQLHYSNNGDYLYVLVNKKVNDTFWREYELRIINMANLTPIYRINLEGEWCSIGPSSKYNFYYYCIQGGTLIFVEEGFINFELLDKFMEISYCARHFDYSESFSSSGEYMLVSYENKILIYDVGKIRIAYLDAKDKDIISGECTSPFDIYKSALIVSIYEKDFIEDVHYGHGENEVIALVGNSAIKTYNSNTGFQVKNINLTKPATKFNYFHDGEIIGILTFTNSIQFYSLASGSLLVELFPLDNGDWVHISQDGRFDASPNAMNHLSWTLGFETYPLAKFKDRYYQPGLFGETMKEHLKGASDGTSASD